MLCIPDWFYGGNEYDAAYQRGYYLLGLTPNMTRQVIDKLLHEVGWF